MEAIDRPSLSALAGAVLGLFVGLTLLAAGAMNVLNALLATAVLALLVGLLIPTSSRPASSVGDRPCGAHESHEAELDGWLDSRAAAGCSTAPNDALAAEATRGLARRVTREQLVASWERVQASYAVRRMLVIGGAS